MSDDLGQFIRERRTRKDLTPTELAEIVGCHPTFIRGIERGAQDPSLDMAKRILAALEVTYRQPRAGRTLVVGRKRFDIKSRTRGDNGRAKTVPCVCTTCGDKHRRKEEDGD